MHRWINQDRLPSNFLQQLATFPWYDSSQVNDATPRIQPGTAWFDADTGNAFAYVQAHEALANGQMVSWLLPGVGSSIAAPTGTDVFGNTPDNKFAVNITGGSPALTTNGEFGNWLYVPNLQAAPGPTLKRIKGNTSGNTPNITIAVKDTASTVPQYDGDMFATALTSGATYLTSIIRPRRVQICAGATPPIGVALGTVTAAYYTIIQIAGLALCQADGVTNGAIVAGQPATVQSSGCVAALLQLTASTQITALSTNYAIAGGGLIEPLVLFSTSSSTPYSIPCYINMIGVL
jgi:hypothetical protein